MKACDEQAALIIQRCSPTAAQKPAAAEGNTMRVRGHICVYRSLLSVTEDRQSWGADAYTPTTPHQQSTATRKKLTLSLQCSCVSYCGAGGSSVRFSSKLRLLAVTVYLSLYPTTTTQRLCCFVRAALPELFLACCYRSNSKRCV